MGKRFFLAKPSFRLQLRVLARDCRRAERVLAQK